MLKQNVRGGTNYELAIQKAGSLIETHFDPTKYDLLNNLKCKYSI